MPTKIEWCDHTWSPITGCSPISEGCQNCYARRFAQRMAGRCGYPKDDPFRVTFHPGRLEDPVKWKRPRKIFISSMGDLFHEDVPFSWIDQVLSISMIAPQHTYLLLTKRPAMALKYSQSKFDGHKSWIEMPNVWLGVTAENQKRADERIPILLKIPAAVRFVSFEPMLQEMKIRFSVEHGPAGATYTMPGRHAGIDWVLTGAETGPNKRHMNPDWARSLRDQTKAAGKPFFFKKDSVGRHELDGRVWEEFPK